jgi:DNA-binding transcriptional MerR regulator
MPDYSLAELVALSGIPSRTIRYYIAEGLIPSPGRDGPGTRYPATTLAKLRVVAKLRVANQPLATIRQRLEKLNDAELMEMAATPSLPSPADSALDYIRSVLGVDESQRGYPAPVPPRSPAPAAPSMAFRTLSHAADPMPQPTPAPTPTEPSTPSSTISERSQWERIALVPGIELHVRRPQSRRENRMVERLIAFARQLQGEDQL